MDRVTVIQTRRDDSSVGVLHHASIQALSFDARRMTTFHAIGGEQNVQLS